MRYSKLSLARIQLLLAAVLSVVQSLLEKSLCMDTMSVPPAAPSHTDVAAMADMPGAILPGNTEEASQMALDAMLMAAAMWDSAAWLAKEGEEVAHMVNAAERLRDMVTTLAPPTHAWPKGGAAIFDLGEFRRSGEKKRVN